MGVRGVVGGGGGGRVVVYTGFKGVGDKCTLCIATVHISVQLVSHSSVLR